MIENETPSLVTTPQSLPVTDPVQPLSPNDTVTPPKTKNTRMLFLTGFLALAIIGGAGYYLGFHAKSAGSESVHLTPDQLVTTPENSSGDTAQSSPVPQVSEESTNRLVAPTATPDLTTLWKVYSNENTGVSFKYPGDTRLSEGNLIEVSYKGSKQSKSLELEDGYNVGFGLPFKAASVEQYAKQQSSNNGIQLIGDVREITINGMNGYTCDYKAKEGSTIPGTLYSSTYVTKNDFILSAQVAYSDPEKKGYKETTQKIISTLEMIHAPGTTDRTN